MKEQKPPRTDTPADAPSENPVETPGRRNLLKTLAAGGAAVAFLPAQWTRPVVGTTVLPAHAATTCGNCSATTIDTMFDISNTGSTHYVEIIAVSSASAGCNSGDVLAQLLFGSNVLSGPSSQTSVSVGASCNGTVCVTSVSLWVYTTDVPGSNGQQVTARFTWPGGCVASAVGTLAEEG